jgi:hypothetical protein
MAGGCARVGPCPAPIFRAKEDGGLRKGEGGSGAEEQAPFGNRLPCRLLRLCRCRHPTGKAALFSRTAPAWDQ